MTLDLDPQHIDAPELSAEQRAIRVAEHSGMHVWSRGDGEYRVGTVSPAGGGWLRHWRNPALEKPMSDDNDSQACIRHLRTELAKYEQVATEHAARAGQLAAELAECRAELRKYKTSMSDAVYALQQGKDVITAERDDAVTALAKRSQELAECRLELGHKKTARNILAGEVPKVQRALAECQSQRNNLRGLIQRIQGATERSGFTFVSGLRDDIKAVLP